MKKLVIILATLIVFFLCLLVGFQIGDWVLPEETTTTTSAPVLAGKQQNIIIIHVDQLENSRPDLISVWVLFLYYSDAPSMMFKAIYSNDGSANQISPSTQMLSIQPDGTLQQDFLRSLQSNLKIQSDGYVLVDDDAILMFSKRFPGPGPTLEPYQVTIPPDDQLVQNICSYLGTKEARRGVELPWNEVLPNHFRTDMNFTSFMSHWIRLTQAANPPNCKLITQP